MSSNMQSFTGLILLILFFQNFSQTNEWSLDKVHFGTIDPEAFMTVPQIIQYHGYPVKSYDVQTDDGYILTVFRIPYGKVKTINQTKGHVLIQHAIMANAGIWVSNLPKNNLPYILADNGYDVWLSNVRGTAFGRRHVRLSDKDKDFWNFRLDEIAKFDIPKIIDTILNETGANHVHYIAHSMGTTVGFAMLSSQPKYNQVVKSFIALAPVAAPANCKRFFNVVSIFALKFEKLARLLGIYKYEFSPYIANIAAKTICHSPLVGICTEVIFTLTGADHKQFNQSRFPVFVHHTPDGSSWDTWAQFGQMIESKKFEYRDFGRIANVKKYGQPTPLPYDLSKITTSVALFWSDNDLAAVPEDVATIASRTKSVTLNYRVPFAKFTHLDFVWATDVDTLVFDKVVETLENIT